MTYFRPTLDGINHSLDMPIFPSMDSKEAWKDLFSCGYLQSRCLNHRYLYNVRWILPLIDRLAVKAA